MKRKKNQNVLKLLKTYDILYLGLLSSKTTSAIKVESSLPNSVFDYDAYDAKVFALPVTRTSKVFEYIMNWVILKMQTCSDISRFKL